MDRNRDTQYPWMEGDPRRSSDMELSTSLERPWEVFVVPFNTPGTKTQPHLTQKRLGEAKDFGFSQGGTLPPNKELSPSAAFEHVYELAKKAGGAKFPEIVAAQAMHETGYLNPKLPSVS